MLGEQEKLRNKDSERDLKSECQVMSCIMDARVWRAGVIRWLPFHCLRLAIGTPFYNLWNFLLRPAHGTYITQHSAGEHMLQTQYISLSPLFAHTERFWGWVFSNCLSHMASGEQDVLFLRAITIKIKDNKGHFLENIWILFVKFWLIYTVQSL